MKTPITYYGGKQNMVKHILPLIPEHLHYVEPFFGGGALFFAKEPSKLETINDLSDLVIKFFRQTKTNFDELKKLIDGTANARKEYLRAMAVYKNPEFFSEVQLAWAFYVGTQAGVLAHLGSWKSSTNVVRTTFRNKLENFSAEYAERLKFTQIECKDALEVIKQRDSEVTLFFIDPPYFNSNQGHYKGYNETDYINLLDTLKTIKGKFILSSYPSEVLSRYLSENPNWNAVSFDMNKDAANKKEKGKRKTEVVVKNF